ncbi:MAG: CcmD family protein [Gemmatimonadota bacterium]|nr:CcmD family protein [Gemmatimonadota bacterium]
MDNLHYLFAAFAVVWIVLFAYLARLNRRTGELGRQLADLEMQLRNKEGDLPDDQESQVG